MKNGQTLDNLIFLDIETVSQFHHFEDLHLTDAQFWQAKEKYWRRDSKYEALESSEIYARKAGIYAEFSKIVCISIGILKKIDDQIFLRLKSFYGKNENEILADFKGLLDQYFNNTSRYKFVGHNIKEFDVPFLARRYLINGFGLPELCKIAGKKPWQVHHLIDTLELWRFGDFKNYTSLNLLAKILDVPSPKIDLDGSKIHEVYWQEGQIDRIKEYCEKDVVTCAKIYMKLKELSINQPLNIIYVND